MDGIRSGLGGSSRLSVRIILLLIPLRQQRNMHSFISFATAAVLLAPALASAYVVVSDPQHPPHQTEEGQYGYNDCQGKYSDSRDSKCQSK